MYYEVYGKNKKVRKGVFDSGIKADEFGRKHFGKDKFKLKVKLGNYYGK